MNSLKKPCIELFDCGSIKFGEFTMKSGLKSPVYIDLRVLVSYQNILRAVAKKILEIGKGAKAAGPAEQAKAKKGGLQWEA